MKTPIQDSNIYRPTLLTPNLLDALVNAKAKCLANALTLPLRAKYVLGAVNKVQIF